MYQNYIFDLYGTLVDIHTEENKKDLWEKLRIFYAYYEVFYTTEELKTEYNRICKKLSEEMGDSEFIEIDLERTFRQLFEQKGYKPSNELVLHTAQMFRLTSTEYLKVYDGVFIVLKELRRRGKKIYLLSNAQKVFTEYELKALKLYNQFDGIMISSEEGIAKPSVQFYSNLFEKFHLKKEESIMIGNDAITDIEGSFQFGIDSIYIHSNLSPEIKGNLQSNYAIMDGEVLRLMEYI